jgi:DNA-binding NarL/FixJ family response regulator
VGVIRIEEAISPGKSTGMSTRESGAQPPVEREVVCVSGWESTMRRQYSFATIIVGQSSLLREGVARILRSANFRVAASISCADDLPTKVQTDQLLILIVHTGNDFDFLAEQIELFRQRYPAGRIAIVADRYRPDELVCAFRAGAKGYFVDLMTCDVFIRSLELVMMGETILPPAFLSYVLGPEGDQLDDASLRRNENEAILVTEGDVMAPQLSSREKLILHCLIEGDSNKSIARKMDIAEATVKVHVKAILRKIRVHNRTQAAIWGMNNGWSPQATNRIAPPLPSDMAKRLPNGVEPNADIEPNGVPVAPDVTRQITLRRIASTVSAARKPA